MGIARNIARLIPNGSGLLPNANIEAVAASKLTGQVPDANAPSESVIQVVQTVMTSAAAYSGSAYNEISPLNTSITPSSTSSKILIIPSIDYAAPNGYRTGLRIRRNGTDILLGDASSTRNRTSQIGRFFDGSDQMVCQANRMYLDSPSSTSSVTYSFALSLENVTGNSIQINRTVSDADFSNHYRGTSTIILMEIRA